LDVDFTQAYYPGDGCCIQWNVDGTCCVDIYQQCCGAAEYGNNYYTDNNYYGGDVDYYGGGGYYGGGRGYYGGGWGGRVSSIICFIFYEKIN
jgi:hypothetical protein